MAQQRAILERRISVQQRVGLSRSTIYSMIGQGRFPAPVRIGARAVAWDSSAIDKWISDKLAAKGAA